MVFAAKIIRDGGVLVASAFPEIERSARLLGSIALQVPLPQEKHRRGGTERRIRKAGFQKLPVTWFDWRKKHH
jgi:hypothetical protein